VWRRAGPVGSWQCEICARPPFRSWCSFVCEARLGLRMARGANQTAAEGHFGTALAVDRNVALYRCTSRRFQPCSVLVTARLRPHMRSGCYGRFAPIACGTVRIHSAERHGCMQGYFACLHAGRTAVCLDRAGMDARWWTQASTANVRASCKTDSRNVGGRRAGPVHLLSIASRQPRSGRLVLRRTRRVHGAVSYLAKVIMSYLALEIESYLTRNNYD
jgi:hypothetical protein